MYFILKNFWFTIRTRRRRGTATVDANLWGQDGDAAEEEKIQWPRWRRRGRGRRDATDGSCPRRHGSEDNNDGGRGGGDGHRRQSGHQSRDDRDDHNDSEAGDGNDDDPTERLWCVDGGERASVKSVADARNNQIDERARAERVGRGWQGLRSVAPVLARILRRRRETTNWWTTTTTDNTQQSNRIRWR